MVSRAIQDEILAVEALRGRIAQCSATNHELTELLKHVYCVELDIRTKIENRKRVDVKPDFPPADASTDAP